MMKFLKSFGLGPQSFLLGIGIAAVTSMLTPALKKGARNIAVKGTQGAMMAGGVLSESLQDGKDKLSRMVNNNEETQQMYQQLFQEIKSEKEQLKTIMSEINNLKAQLNNNNNQPEQNGHKNPQPEQKNRQ